MKYQLLHRVIRHLNPGKDLKNIRPGQKIQLVRYVRTKVEPKPTVTKPAKEKAAAEKPNAAAVKPAPALSPALPVSVKKAKVSVLAAPKSLDAPLPPAPKGANLPLTPAPVEKAADR